MRIHILGGDPAVAEVLEEAVRERGHEPVRAPAGIAAGEPVVDLGLAPPELAAAEDPVRAEGERAAAVLASVPPGNRLVRVSLLGAGRHADPWLARAAGAAEEAQADRATVLRVGVLLGDLGLVGAFRRRVERSRIVPVPGVAHARIEPLDVTDLGEYAVAAATADRELDAVYELGCGEMSSGSLLVRDLADNLGMERWVVPLPTIARWSVARWLATPAAPAEWIDGMLEVLPLLVPRRMNAWEHFDVKPVDLRTSFARAAGMEIPLRRRKEEGDSFAWKRPERKGILWSRRRR